MIHIICIIIGGCIGSIVTERVLSSKYTERVIEYDEKLDYMSELLYKERNNKV